MSKTYQGIPTNLITGFLGSGKTTVILELLKSRPAGSRWAVLVNEFGDVGIDGALLAQQGIAEGAFIKEVPGGCMCCAAGLPLQMALNLLIKQAKPERILIEPTGVGHPGKVMETLTGEFYKQVLDMRASICLVEANKLSQDKYMNNETFVDQMVIADVLIASKSDQADDESLEHFKTFGESFKIPKAQVQCIEFGQLSADLLDIPRNPQRSVQFPDAHQAHKHTHDTPDPQKISLNTASASSGNNLCDWRRFENNGQDYYGCGWIFNRTIIFDALKLEQVVKADQLSRAKGIFRTTDGWFIFNRSDEQYSKEVSDHTADSRIEIIEPDYHDWNFMEEQLINCIETYRDED